MVVLPADHQIRNLRLFRATLRLAVRLAREGKLVTIGVYPTRPDTGYGYIESGRELRRQGSRVAFEAVRFREKPDLVTARRFVASRRFFWNSGMFVFGVESILDSFRTHLPATHRALEEYRRTGDIERLYRRVQSISIDYAIMEKATNIAVIRGDFVWDDVGSWLALERLLPHDDHGNCTRGRTLALDTAGTIISTDHGLVATLGVSNLVIVRSEDALLVADKTRAGEVKRIVQTLQSRRNLRRYL
jgi:mannose-1-phosphate guanylyltransferase